MSRKFKPYFDDLFEEKSERYLSYLYDDLVVEPRERDTSNSNRETAHEENAKDKYVGRADTDK